VADTEHVDALRQTDEAMTDASFERLAAFAELSCNCGLVDCEIYMSGLTRQQAQELVAEAKRARAELAKLRPEYGARVTYTDTLTAEGPIGDDAGEARARAADLAENSAVVSVTLLQRPVGDWQNVEKGDGRG